MYKALKINQPLDVILKFLNTKAQSTDRISGKFIRKYSIQMWF